MADISKVTLPNNETYDLKDSVARGGIGNAKLFYGTCSSAAATTEKAVTCSEFTANDLVAGTMINVKFDNTNSGAVASLTLNVNGTGAKSIKYIYNNKLNNIPAAGYLLANNMYTFRYDGTNWVVQLMYNTDNNTTTVQDVYVGYNYGISGTNGYKQYSILMNDEQGLPTSLTTTNGTGTKTKATNGFQLGEMYYYNGSVNVNAGEAGSSILKYVSLDVDARYSFNCGSTLVAGKSLYLVGSIGDNGLFYLDDTWWTMSLPTSDDGKVYVLVGNVVSTTKVHLIPFHPCYVYKNGGVQLYSPNYITDNYVPTTRKINNKVLSSDITLTASDVGALPSSTSIPTATTTTPKMNGTAAVGSETKWAKGDHVHPSDTSKVNKSGDTMTGLLKLNPSQYTDSHTVGALDLQNSNIIGTNGIYFADSSDGAGEAINFYRDATHADSIHAYNGALYFTPNRELGTGGTPKRVIVDGSTFPEAYLSWGGRNFSASYGPIDAAMVDYLGANRFAFLKADGITVEYTRDNGETWIDYGLTDAQKAGLFSTTYACVVGKSSNTDANRANANCQLRVTIDTNLAKCYTVLNKFIFFVSTTGSGGSWASLDVATHGNPTTWVNKFNKVGIGGWSGYNVINTGEITTYGNSNSQYQYLRFTFGIETQSSSYAGLSVSKIMAYGGVGWTTASNMATHGHLYSFDSSQNAFFPAKVTATEFSGIVNATTATGTLPIAHGGTEGTTALEAANNLKVPFLGSTNKITSGTDFNTITTPGTYGVQNVGIANSCANCPVAMWGVLTVNYADGVNSSWTGQEYVNGQTGVRYHRYLNGSGGSWSAWRISNNLTTMTGTLPVANGGTGKTTAVDAANNLIKDLTVGSSDPVDGDTYIASYADGKNTAGTGTNTFHRRPITSLWNYMKSKISTVLGIGGSSGVPTAPTATAGTNNTQIATTAFVHSAINTAIGDINSFDVEVVQSLPTSNIKDHTIYFVRKTGSTNDVYDEYMYINSAWEHIGSTDVDLSGYVPTTRTINSKELSSNITLSASDVGALPADQILTVDQGGIGLSSVTPGNYIKANSSHTFGQLTPAQVLSDIGAAASGHTHTTTIASGGTSQINLAANTAYTLTAGGTNYVFKTPADSDTKNTTGSTDTSSEIYLVGATSQAANPQTYSHDTARVRANGRIVGSGYEFAVASAMGTTKATMVYDSTLEAIAFQFD